MDPEQLEYCRTWACSDGYIHCDDCVEDCKISGLHCLFRPPDGVWEYCDFFICDGGA